MILFISGAARIFERFGMEQSRSYSNAEIDQNSGVIEFK